MSVSVGQTEAGRSLGLNYAQTMWYIVIPQAIKNILPALGNEFIVLLKETAIAGYVGVTDLTRGANIIRGITYQSFWPLLAIAVIVLVRRGDLALLVKAQNFRRDYYGLVAGFVETGENLEEAVAREVLEETGVRINNIRYFASQPWPYPCGLMVGFYADYVSGEIEVQQEELKTAGWFSRDALPPIPGKMSIARQLIDNWVDKG